MRIPERIWLAAKGLTLYEDFPELLHSFNQKEQMGLLSPLQTTRSRTMEHPAEINNMFLFCDVLTNFLRHLPSIPEQANRFHLNRL
jgi:hypothetical protein